MGFFDKLFGKQEKTPKPTEQKTEQKLPSLQEFSKLKAQDRMGLIMAWGDAGKSEHYPYLSYAILEDQDLDVRFAALKRIHLFKEMLPESKAMLTRLKQKGEGEALEPYFSMALSRLGLLNA